ncbi:chitinase-like protein Idgf2 [Drosophila albomicans]|uniref:Chitinase-like protein Idgf2 n=1 Tax=Drosophila albomicans TaxID=7291 RepID=A0A9C6WCK3_DROAB|nr:chitinase-like protein Idgf2 [Drosophila albomicans]
MYRLAVCILLASLCSTVISNESRVVCYYNSESSLRKGSGKLTKNDLLFSASYCTHLVYGYVGISGDNYQVNSLNEGLDIRKKHLTEVTSIRSEYPGLKVLLSVGGDRDIDAKHPNKYVELLEAGQEKQNKFIQSAHLFVKNFGFDGLDLAYQFPRNQPWNKKGIEKLKPNTEQLKEQFATIVQNLKETLQNDELLLSVTVLPNVNSTWYFDIPALDKHVDFVNLAAFDFITPQRNPHEADYSAPLYHNATQNRLPHFTVDFQVQYWKQQGFPSNKLNLGFGIYGNTWRLTYQSGESGVPIVYHAKGPAPGGPYARKDGVASYPEICTLLHNALLYKDSTTKEDQEAYGNYVHYSPFEPNTEGVWVSYDNIYALVSKARYAKSHVGGVAIFDLGYDDYQDGCNAGMFPIMRFIRVNFLSENATYPEIDLAGIPIW